MSRITAFREDTEPPVQGYLHTPDEASGDALVLTHGAGFNCESGLMKSMCDWFAAEGVLVLRCNLPFRQKRPHGPPFPADQENDRKGLLNAVTVIRKKATGRVYLGGQSYGGRMASMLAAEDPRVADGLLLLAYPLHPAGKPENLRTSHLPNLRTPSIFVQGTRDSLGTSEEVKEALKLIPARTLLIPVEGSEHNIGEHLDQLSEVALQTLSFLRGTA